MEGTKMMANWLYQWKTECAHLALRRGRLAALGIWPGCRYYTVLAKGDSTVRWGQMEWGQNKPDQNPYLSPSFSGACSIPGTMCFNRPSLQQDSGSQWRLMSSPHPGCKVTHPSQWDTPCKLLYLTAFPDVMGLGVPRSIVCSSSMAVSLNFCIFTALGVSAGVPSLAYGAMDTTGWSFKYINPGTLP